MRINKKFSPVKSNKRTCLDKNITLSRTLSKKQMILTIKIAVVKYLEEKKNGIMRKGLKNKVGN